MKTSILILATLLAICSLAQGQTITDPTAYYLKTYGHAANDMMLKVKVSFGRKGRKIILLAYGSSGDRSGYLWMGFMPVSGGYVSLPSIEVNGRMDEGSVRFRTDALYEGYIPELKTAGLISYHPAGEAGALTAVVLQDGALKEIRLATIRPEGVDAARYKALFGSHAHTPHVEETAIPAGE